MKYFTEKELEEIANTIIENPTPNTLRELADKYDNGGNEKQINVDSIPQMDKKIEPVSNQMPNINSNIANIPNNLNQNIVNKEPTGQVSVNHSINQNPSLTIPTLNSNIQNKSNQNVGQGPSFDIPTLNPNMQTKPNQNIEIPNLQSNMNQSNQSIENLWEMNNKSYVNKSNEIPKIFGEPANNGFAPNPVTPNNSEMPFFNSNIANNQQSQNMPRQVNNNMPSMFSQFEQNYS